MKYRYALYALCVCASIVTAQDPDLEDLVCKEIHAHQHLAQARSDLSIDDPTFDVKYTRFEWVLNPEVKAVRGTVTHYFETKQADVSSLQFQLSTQLTIDSIQYHGAKLSFVQSGSYDLKVNLPLSLALGALDSLSISYHGVPPTTGFGSFNKSSHAGVPILWSLSCPLGTRDWWPCKNGLTDKIDSIDILITTPSQYRAAGIGKLVHEVVSPDGTLYHWQHRYPIVPYLVAFAVTNYQEYTDVVPLSSGIDMPMVNYVYPESINQAKAGTANLVQVLQFYDSLFFDYPFAQEKYGHAQFGWGGGMEHQTMSFVTNFSWSLLAHELAHQWFGDMVTCGSWEDVWLNEGSATYLEGLTQERFKAEPAWYNWKKGKVTNITSSAAGSVRVPDTTSVNRIFDSRLTYNKGSYLHHMLRWKLGDAAYFSGVRSFLADKQFGFAKTADFQQHLEQASGVDLDGFFQDWFYGQGYPRYQINWWQDANNQLFIQVGQTQSHSSVQFFEMPLPIVCRGQGVDTMLRLEHSYSGQEFVIPLPFQVTGLEFDPTYWLISAGNTVLQISSDTPIDAAQTGFIARPNPVADQFTTLFISAVESAQQANITLYNMEGRPVLSQKVSVHPGETQVRLDTGQLPAGVYQARLATASATKVCRLVKI